MMPRLGAIAAGSAAAVAAGSAALLVACFDLFHGTGDVVTACAIDADLPGCAAPASPQDADTGSPPSDFCAWSRADALAHAQHACAWLGACEAPIDRGALGPCMLQALLAYDCTANPDHRAKGKAHDLWDCLWRVQSCGDVGACVSAVTAEEAGAPCTRAECYGAELHWCADGGDIGIDCAGNGAQACGGFPSAVHAQWVACLAEGDGGACAPSDDARCAGGVASSCPSGLHETIDCRALLGAGAASTPNGGCVDGPLSPAFDWTSPCIVLPPACSGDACDGGIATGCARGAPFSVDCAAEKLGACRMIATHAACTPR
jgi:hypothetical protein